MKKKCLALVCALTLVLALGLMAGCSSQSKKNTLDLADGTYTAEFNTDSTMFHANDAYDGKGTLTVKDGEGTLHVALAGKSVVNLFIGTKDDAQKSGAVLLEPTEEIVTYEDGSQQTVVAFDIPVPVLNEEFDCALVGTKGTWYDHKVSVDNPVAIEE